MQSNNNIKMKKDWMIKESELDDDQIKVLTATLDKSCIVSGCAGSGKSVLALIKAQRIQKERGNDYEIIVYTKALCRYMESGRKALGLNNPFYYYWKWKNKDNKPMADYIIVDEIQDFTSEEIQEFINAARKNFFFFGDTAQSIYDGLKVTVALEDIGYLLPQGNKPKMSELYRNYRLPIQVAKFVQYVGVGLNPFEESTYKNAGGDDSIPHVLQYESPIEQIEAIKRIIGDRLTDAAILLPHNEHVKEVGKILTSLEVNYEQQYRDREDYRNSKDNLDFNTSNLKLLTYHSAKGLQFETVFLPLLETFDVEAKRKALYVAMTRTYKQLYIMYSGNLPNVLADIPAELYTKKEVEEIEDI